VISKAVKDTSMLTLKFDQMKVSQEEAGSKANIRFRHALKHFYL